MSDIKPPGPTTPEGAKPENLPRAQKSAPSEAASSGEEEYLGFTFTSHKALIEFKTKFLARMANEVIREVQRDNDRMIQALKKMREDIQ